MMNKRGKQWLSMMVASSLFATSILAQPVNVMASIKKEKVDEVEQVVDKNEVINSGSQYAADENTPFSWDNANVYFAITDRFLNGDSSNDHSYERSTKEKDADKYETRVGTFHGGDLAGMTKKIEEGYFDELGTNAIWITAPYEQIHGALCSTQFKHYAYHGYYTLDYTNVDGNMGTEKDLETFIDTAHSHGIRVIFDIVMNHAGYADAYTANEYGFGKLADNWEEIYYKWDESKYNWYNDYAGEAEAQGSQGMMIADGDWTTNWWGTGWIRAIGERLGGYEGSEGDSNPLTLCLNGLPDFKVETSGDPGIPAILKNKWTKEGNYDEKIAMTEESLSKGGLNASVTGYISAWLSQWVREYGVDGFRCDTAKHVAVSEWSKLKKACVAALKDWREANPDKPGAQWSDDFWMTGEHWDHGVVKDEYYTSGVFDSMINFSYQGMESKSGSRLEATYSGYAKQINSDPSFNVLSYISSHDTTLGARSANAGTALLLTPGGVQTYYGDESGRTAGAGFGDQPKRSHMNWSSMNDSILSNWQKVGRFRRNHIAVGAGQHTKLADTPYTFSRTYTGKATVGSETKTDYKDKVIVSLPGNSGVHKVPVGDVFADGDIVVDEYTGKEYTVSGGKVSANCDNNGVILLADTGKVQPVSTKQPSATPSATPMATSTKTSVPVETSTVAPTATPNITQEPTTEPTSTPTNAPTPTVAPVETPTRIPTTPPQTEDPNKDASFLTTEKPLKEGQYYVYFECDGGVAATDKMTVTGGEKYGVLPTPSKIGYTFLGWYTNRTDGERITPDVIVNLTSNQTLYARWEQRSYNVNFNANGGNVDIGNKTVFFGDVYEALPVPQKTNEIFLGWYTQEEGGTLITERSIVSIASNHTLYAHWSGNAKKADFESFAYSFANNYETFADGKNYQIPLDCYQYIWNNTIFTKKLYEKYASGSEEQWVGNSFGMAATSVLLYMGDAELNIRDFNSGANRVKDLAITDISQKYQMTLKELIESIDTIKLDAMLQKNCQSHQNRLNDLCNAVEEVEAGQKAPIVLVMSGKQGSHAAVAYKIKENKIFVYDPDFPEEERTIIVAQDSKGTYTTWSYNVKDSYDWGSADGECSISYIAYEDYKEVWSQRTENSYNQKNLLTLSTENAIVYNEKEEAVATIANGVLNSNQEDIFLVQDMAFGTATKDVTLYLPVGTYTIENLNSNNGEFTVDVVDVNQGMTITTEASKVTFTIDDQRKVNRVSCNVMEEQKYHVILESTFSEDKKIVDITGIGTPFGEAGACQSAGEINLYEGNISNVTVEGQEKSICEISSGSSNGGNILLQGAQNASPIQKVLIGEKATYVMQPEEGYVLANVLVDGKSQGAVPVYTFENIQTPHKITVVFAKLDTSAISVGKIQSQTHTGKAITPTVTVCMGSVVLKEKINYQISYSNNKNVGTAKVTITGIGSYKGFKKILKFTIIAGKGESYTVGGMKYQVTDTKGKKVMFASPVSKEKTSVIIPKTVKIGTTTYKVTKIAAKAFNGCSKLKKITVKSTYLTSVGNNAFKGIYKKAVIKVPASKLTKYKKLMKNKGQKKTVQIKK